MDVQVDNIAFSYSDNDILKGVTFSVKSGEMVALLGPNGSGKTTLLKNMSKILAPKTGIISLGENSIENFCAKELAQELAVIPQSFDTTFSFTVEEIVMMGRSPHIERGKNETATDLSIVEESMRATNVWQFRNKLFMNISGGEKQRAIIARALAQEPKILLLDEPTSNLDINHQVEILTTIRKLAEDRNLTVVAAFHDLNLAAKYFDKLVILSKGKVKAIGEPKDVLSADLIKGVYGVDVIVERHPISQSVFVLPITAIPQSVAGRACSVHVMAGGGSGAELMMTLSRAGVNFSLGAVNIIDSDYELAKKLGVTDIAIESPFCPISDETLSNNMDLIEKTDVVILAPFLIGHGNLPNLIAAQKAIEMGKKIIIIDQGDFAERDFTDGIAGAIYAGLTKRGASVVGSAEEAYSIYMEQKTNN